MDVSGYNFTHYTNSIKFTVKSAKQSSSQDYFDWLREFYGIVCVLMTLVLK